MQKNQASSNKKLPKKRKELLFSVLALIFSLMLGVLAALYSWNGKIYFYPFESSDPMRKPSSVLGEEEEGEEGEAGSIQSYTWNQDFPNNFLADSKVEFNEGGVLVSFGHSLLSDVEGNKAFACGSYDKIEAVFHSGDMAINGSPCVMVVDTSCVVSESDTEQIKPLYIPLQLFHDQDPKNESVSLVFEDISYHFTFKNMGFSWPGEWYLASLRLYRKVAEVEQKNNTLWAESETSETKEEEALESGGENRKLATDEKAGQRKSFLKKEFKIKHREILEMRGEPLMIQWKDNN